MGAMANTQVQPTRQVTTPADGVARPALPPVRRRGRLGSLTTVHIVVVELAALAVLGALGATAGRAAALAVAAVVAAVALATVFIPARGGWWYEQAGLRRRWRHRRRAARSGQGGQVHDPLLAPLAGLEPSLAIRAFDDRGTAVGIGQDRDGWFSALAVAVPQDLRGERSGGVPLDRLARMCAEAPVPVTAVSVVSQLIATPTTMLGQQSPAAQSYRELLADEPVGADQQLWVVLRLGPADAIAAAASRGGGLDGVDRAMATLTGRAGKALAAAGMTSRVLDAPSLAATVVGACRPGPVADPGDRGDERWEAWHADDLAHACLQLTGWPSDPPATFFTGLGRVPAALVAVAVTLHPHDDDAEVRCVVRLAAGPDALPAAVTEATAVARRAGARACRLDGRQAAAVYATAPTAAGVR
jgi:type VII secretion protein EccE